MGSSTEGRMDDIVRAARKIVKAAKAGDADAVIEHAMSMQIPVKRIVEDDAADAWNDRYSTQIALDAWAAEQLERRRA